MMMIDIFRSVHKKRLSGVVEKGEDPTSSSLLAQRHRLVFSISSLLHIFLTENGSKAMPKGMSSSFLKANMIAPAYSTALPTIDDKIIERKLIVRPMNLVCQDTLEPLLQHTAVGLNSWTNILFYHSVQHWFSNFTNRRYHGVKCDRIWLYEVASGVIRQKCMECFLIRSQSELVHKVECFNSLSRVICRCISINDNKHSLMRRKRQVVHISNKGPSSRRLSVSTSACKSDPSLH